MADDKNIRHRFTVPVGDTIVNEWIAMQSHLGFSLRVLIKAFVRDYGMQDATCLEFGVGVKKRGRPPKTATIHLQNMLPGYEIDADADADQEEAVKSTQRVPESNDSDIMNMMGSHGVTQPSSSLPLATDDSDFVDPDDLM